MKCKLFAEKLKLLRKDTGWTQEEASKAIGIALSTLRSYEQGGTPELNTLEKIVNKFVVSYDYLLNDNIPVIYSEDEFVNILNNILMYYTSVEDMAHACGMSATSLRNVYLKGKRTPEPAQLRKIAEGSKGVITYIELMEICGYVTNKDIFEYPYGKE